MMERRYERFENMNPIIRTTDNSEKWCSKGHGSIFEDKEGNWWFFKFTNRPLFHWERECEV